MKYLRKGIYNSQNHLTLQKKVKNMKHFVPPTSNLAPKWKFLQRYQVGNIQLIISRGQSDYSVVFIFVSFEEKGYYCVVSVGQLIFDCRSYCGLSHRMHRFCVHHFLRLATANFMQVKINKSSFWKEFSIFQCFSSNFRNS